jgi:hypothetical protein
MQQNHSRRRRGGGERVLGLRRHEAREASGLASDRGKVCPVAPRAHARARLKKSRTLRTPSGRIELYSDEIVGFAYDDCTPHPAWIEPAEWLGGGAAARFPLHLVSSQPQHKLHSQMDAGPVSARGKTAGRETLAMNPADARERGIGDGEVVRVFNDRGAGQEPDILFNMAENTMAYRISYEDGSAITCCPSASRQPLDTVPHRRQLRHLAPVAANPPCPSPGGTRELCNLVEYANKFHHDTNPAWEAERINDRELLDFVNRTFKFTKRR